MTNKCIYCGGEPVEIQGKVFCKVCDRSFDKVASLEAHVEAKPNNQESLDSNIVAIQAAVDSDSRTQEPSNQDLGYDFSGYKALDLNSKEMIKEMVGDFVKQTTDNVRNFYKMFRFYSKQVMDNFQENYLKKNKQSPSLPNDEIKEKQLAAPGRLLKENDPNPPSES